MDNARLASIMQDVNCGIHEHMLLPSYLTEPQMMMMSNTAKKKDNRTPRMICSSLVNSPSTMQGHFNRSQITKNKVCTQCVWFL